METRWKEIQSIWKSNQSLFVIAGFLAGILFFPALEALSQNASDLLAGFVPEAVGIGFTVLLVDRAYQIRENQREKARLIRQMGSHHNGIALQAVWELIALGHTTDGSLKGKYFTSANLVDATLLNADFEGAFLTSAKLRHADLVNANLMRANLTGANLTQSTLWRTNLRGSMMTGANLESAQLAGADLCGAYLYSAYLGGAAFFDEPLSEYIDSAILDETTVLPDRTRYQPELGLEQLLRFTDRNHPDFWEPDWVKRQRGKSSE